MTDAKTLLDNVRAKVPSDAKIIVAWYHPTDKLLHLGQANMNQADISDVGNTLANQMTMEKLNRKHG